MTMARDIAAEILEGLDDAAAYLDGQPTNARVTTVKVPERVDVRAVRQSVGASQAEFAARFGIPVDTLRKWERGAREPDAAGKLYLHVIARNPKAVEEALASERLA